MEFFFEMIRSIVLGIVEGITEWLPVSSTGHMILLNEIIKNTGFTASDLYLYVIQLGAILAVVTLYFHKLNPFAPSKTAKEKRDTWQMWCKVIIACLPAAVIGLLLDAQMEQLECWEVVSAALILYGVVFLLLESRRGRDRYRIGSVEGMSYRVALLIGVFQVLSIIPGTSRSGSTILGAMLLGCSRAVAAEFSFFLAIPVMFGVSLLKILKYGLVMSGAEVAVLLSGMAVAYLVSLLAIRFLTGYVKKHDFKLFGWYRIVLGLVVILYFMLLG